jgi:hypothetical protein
MSVVSNVIRVGAAKPNPFTICIVANPVLEAPWNSGAVMKDPIIGQLAAFQAAVSYIDSSLFGLLPGEQEHLLSDPALMPFIRVVSLYDDGLPTILSNALAAQDGSSDILVPIRTAHAPFLANYGIDADVVYAVSASQTHVRASAWFTTDDDTQGGVPFTLDGNAYVHRYYKAIPGTIAIPVNSTSLTALHEFGHAVSSYTNGSIVDLYVDSSSGFNIRVGRPIPTVFCNYQGTQFDTDPLRDGIGYPAGWQSYHCELVDASCPAVMDNYWLSGKGSNACLHDSVTKAFIFDRVAAKIARP